MASNEILQFASTDTGTNLLTQTEYSADTQRTTGNQPGIARSKLVNKAMRQSALMASGLGHFIAQYQGNNVVDSLSASQIAAYLYNAIQGALNVTQPQFDKDTSLATTEFVQRALGNRAATVGYTANVTQPKTDFGALAIATGAGGFTITAPSVVGVNLGAMLEYANFSNSAVTLQSSGPNWQGAGYGASQTFTLMPGQAMTAVYDGASFDIVNLSGATATRPQFDSTTYAANTAFVQRALGNRAGIIGYTANATQPATDFGKTALFTGAGGYTLTTPSFSGVAVGATLEYANFANTAVTLQSTGPNWQGSGYAASTSFTLQPGCAFTAVYDGVSLDIVNLSGFGQTAPQFTNSALLANTAFVQRALGNMRGFNYTLNSTVTITPDQVGQGWMSGGSTNNYYLPATSSVPEGASIHIYCQGGTATVFRQGSDVIAVGGTAYASLFMSTQEYATFVKKDGSWAVANGTPMLPNCGLYANSKAQSGYTRFPNGIILQWGRVNAGNTGGVYDVTFPVTFPNAGFAGMANDWSNSVVGSDINAVDFLTQTYMRVWCSTNADTVSESNFWWFAVGY